MHTVRIQVRSRSTEILLTETIYHFAGKCLSDEIKKNKYRKNSMMMMTCFILPGYNSEANIYL